MRTRRWTVVCLLAGLIASGSPLRADCAAGEHTVILGIIEGPDPIGTVLWVLCGGGCGSSAAPLGDGRPDVVSDAVTGWPIAVWADTNGPSHDIGFSEWEGESWRPVSYIDASSQDVADPRLYADGGPIYVVWWEPATLKILLTSRQPDSTQWSVPRVVATGGRRPSIALWGGRIHIAYERSASWGGQEIVVQTRKADGTTTEAIAATTFRTGRLDPVLHVEGGRVWLDWKGSDTEMSYSRLADGFWGAPLSLSWTDPSWSGEKEARQQIRALVLGQ